MIEEILWFFLGIVAGTITGLVPGIHANTIAALAIYFPLEKNTGFAIFIISMSITHSIVDAIPSILLGAPAEETSVNLLPGHEMLMKGKGIDAIRLTALGSMVAIIASAMLLPVFYSAGNMLKENLHSLIPAAITGTILLMILHEKNKPHALITVMLAGIMGEIALNASMKEPVFVLVIGFFAIPGLLQTITTNTKIPFQEKTNETIQSIKPGIIAALSAGVLTMFPAIGPSQAATIVKTIYGKMTKKAYLMLTGGINTANLMFSALVLFTLEKTRTGMAVALNEIPSIGTEMFPTIIMACLAAAGFGAFITDFSSEKAIELIMKINYAKISLGILGMIIALVFLVSGITGLIACFGATGIAFFGISGKVKRSHLMAFLLIPTLIFYLGF